jgi:SAM-dependent methyltransferase
MDTKSVTPSMYDHPVENGRTYHAYKDGKYWGSNDAEANEHMNIGHGLYVMTFHDELFLAPISPCPGQILDLGTGTGIWATQVADLYPSAIVRGIDLSPVQPIWVPPNVRFEVDDIESEWTFPDNYFDFIYIRGLHGSINNWPALYCQCRRALKPGGYLEQAEYSPQFTSDDDSLPCGYGIEAWNKVWVECEAVLNREIQILDSIKQYLIDAGFEHVIENRYRWPIGPWPEDPKLKELGEWAKAHVESGLENWTLRLLTKVMGWNAEEVYVLCANVRRDIRDPAVHALHRMNVVYGRKPDDDDDNSDEDEFEIEP